VSATGVSIRLPRLLALLIPAGLLGGALGSQYLGGLYPCEMCHWQRWPHYAALALALTAFIRPDRALVRLAALLIAVSGIIGSYHAGVEYGWWAGLSACTTTAVGSSFKDIWAAPVARCDQAPWSLFGFSLAGYNALFSLGGAALILGLLWQRPAPPAR
jgi:disulfide bond formation protein DsbB